VAACAEAGSDRRPSPEPTRVPALSESAGGKEFPLDEAAAAASDRVLHVLPLGRSGHAGMGLRNVEGPGPARGRALSPGALGCAYAVRADRRETS
jgi:hypothetical protein